MVFQLLIPCGQAASLIQHSLYTHHAKAAQYSDIETIKAILEFYSRYNNDFGQTLCNYMKKQNQLHLIEKRGKSSSKGAEVLRKQVEYYQKKLKEGCKISPEQISKPWI